MAGFDHLPSGVVPFAVSAPAAAALIGISEGHFRKLVTDGMMPPPRELAGRVLWDTDEVRAAWRAIPRRGDAPRGNTWDDP